MNSLTGVAKEDKFCLERKTDLERVRTVNGPKVYIECSIANFSVLELTNGDERMNVKVELLLRDCLQKHVYSVCVIFECKYIFKTVFCFFF